MPAGGIHLCVGKRVLEKLNLHEGMEYYLGVVSADSWRNSSSTRMGTHFLDSNDSIDYHYELFFNKYFSFMDNPFVLGYLVHLITDKYWYSKDFITSNIYEDEYCDMKNLCSELIRSYNIPKLFLVNFDNPISELDSIGVKYTIDYLNDVNYVSGNSLVFDINTVESCIEETSNFIVSEINRLNSLVGVV